MIYGIHPLWQTLLGTLLTWGVTALGAALCILDSTSIDSKTLLRGSLGFSGGVMLSASFWSLLVPAKEIATDLGYGQFAFLPLIIGFIAGCGFVFMSDKYFPIEDYLKMMAPQPTRKSVSSDYNRPIPGTSTSSLQKHSAGKHSDKELRKRKGDEDVILVDEPHSSTSNVAMPDENSWMNNKSRHVALMILAITIHNIPEGMAVGVGFGVEGGRSSFESARSLAIGIAIQNFPEGLAVSLPLKAAGMSFAKSFWYGQLSGAVEPIAALLGCLAVQLANPLLPYALSFAAGAMVFVVLDDVVPECNLGSGEKLGSFSFIFGFVVMMILDVALG